MKIHFIVFFVLVLMTSPSSSFAEITYTTHNAKGDAIATFTQVHGLDGFGESWKDPNGVIWSSYIGDFTNIALQPDQGGLIEKSPATDACAKLGGTLPTIDDYAQFHAYFENNECCTLWFSDQGKKDLLTMFPSLENRWLWTSSLSSHDSMSVIYFDANSGELSDDQRQLAFSVQCIAKSNRRVK